MHLLNPVLVQRIHHQADAVCCGDGFPNLRQVIQQFDDQAAYGVVVLGIQGKLQRIVDVVQLHGTFNDVLIGANLLDELFLGTVVFVPDLAHDLLQQILKGDQPGSGAVLVQNDGEIHRIILHLQHELGDFLVFIGKVCFPQNIADMKIFLRPLMEKQIFHIDDTDDIVRRIFVDRKPGKHFFLENFQQVIVAVINIGKYHIGPGNHDIFGLGVAKIKHVVDHDLFFIFQNAFLMAYFHDGAQLVGGEVAIFLIRVDPQKQHQSPGKKIHDKDHRRQQPDQGTDRDRV